MEISCTVRLREFQGQRCRLDEKFHRVGCARIDNLADVIPSSLVILLCLFHCMRMSAVVMGLAADSGLPVGADVVLPIGMRWDRSRES